VLSNGINPVLSLPTSVETAQVAPEGWRHGGGETGGRETGLGHAASQQRGMDAPFADRPSSFISESVVRDSGAIFFAHFLCSHKDQFAGSELGRTKCARRAKARDGFCQSTSPIPRSGGRKLLVTNFLNKQKKATRQSRAKYRMYKCRGAQGSARAASAGRKKTNLTAFETT